MSFSNEAPIILDTSKQVLWQTVKTQMKGNISSGSAPFAWIKRNSDQQPYKLFVCFGSLHLSQQLWSCRYGQFT